MGDTSERDQEQSSALTATIPPGTAVLSPERNFICVAVAANVRSRPIWETAAIFHELCYEFVVVSDEVTSVFKMLWFVNGRLLSCMC